MNGPLAQFWHPYYLLRLLGCFPALFQWLWLTVPTQYFSQQQIEFIASYQLTLTIPLIALPTLVLLRLRQIRSKFHLLTLSPETVLDAWFTHFVAFNLGSLGFLGGWVAACTYLVGLIGFGLLFPKPAYMGPSRLRVITPERFAAEVLNQNYSSVIGFSPDELLNMNPETLQKRRLDLDKTSVDAQFQTKTWIIWPVSGSRKRSQVGLIDMEAILAGLSLQYDNSDELEFVILDLQKSTALCASLKIWAEDDSISPTQHNVEELVLLKYKASREIDRMPPRNHPEDDDSDEEETPSKKHTQTGPVSWSKDTVQKALILK